MKTSSVKIKITKDKKEIIEKLPTSAVDKKELIDALASYVLMISSENIA